MTAPTRTAARPPAAGDACGCSGYRVSRRSVLAGGLLGLGASVVASAAGGYRAFAATPGNHTLVVLSLRGGADGLSLVAPVGDPDYARNRPTIAVPVSRAVQLDQTFGLHPGLAPLKPFYDAGSLAIVHAAGSPDPTRSHFDAQRELERAAFTGSGTPTGWLDRYVSSLAPGSPLTAVQRGDLLPESLAGAAGGVAMGSLSDFALDAWSGFQPDYNNALHAMYGGLSHPVGAAAGTTLSAVATAGAVAGAPYTPSKGATYGTDETAQGLQDIARLVKANVGLRVATLDMGNWDMHQAVGAVDVGWMHDQATALAKALAAFATDLGAGLANVTVVTVSEFGRRVAENSSGGLDHGHGQPMIVLGGGVRGGRVFGKWPTLAPAALDDGDLAATTDYRSVLADVLAGPMGATATDLASVFPGWQRSAVGIF